LPGTVAVNVTVPEPQHESLTGLVGAFGNAFTVTITELLYAVPQEPLVTARRK
jgi:hypothetical protein